MIHLRLFFSIALILASLPGALLAHAQEEAPPNHVIVAPLKGVVNPPLAEFVGRAIDHAEMNGASAVVLEMDTPGGLDSSMREINQRILASNVPVVVYVYPPGGRAGSAGVYIAYAAHVAAMAPNTNIGSATPVLAGGEGEAQMSDEMRAKVQEDAVAYLQGLAEQRGRNAEWAERAVREGANVTAREAAELNVVDLVAPNLETLLLEIDGRTVETVAGEVQLATAGASVERKEMNLVESLLHIISDPTIAYILLSLGMLGLFLEFSNPGSILPGVSGVIALLLAFYSLGTLPVNFAGLALLVFGFLLIVADLFTPTHGILTAGGAIAFVLGSLLLFNVPEAAPFLEVSFGAILAVSVILVGFLVFAVGAAIRGQRRKVVTGRESLVGQTGQARTRLNPDGMVWLDGELWRATSVGGRINPGRPVEVVKVERLHLYVRPADSLAPVMLEQAEPVSARAHNASPEAPAPAAAPAPAEPQPQRRRRSARKASTPGEA